MPKRISGTLEWAVANKNCLQGCSHGCRYCYTRAMALRFNRTTREDWEHPVLNEDEANKRPTKKKGTIMFPTTHDILPEFLEPEIEVIRRLLAVGNNVLIVSKPHLECIQAICKEFTEYKDNILFRFTIGCFDDDILGYWEPRAPHFLERFASLKHAFQDGYQTSVSCEPMLDSDNMCEMFEMLEPLVTDGIWIGKMNKIRTRVPCETEEDALRITRIEEGQTDDKIRNIYKRLKNEPKVRWKESIKEVMGIPAATVAGTDR